METLQQNPELTKIQFEKRNAMQTAFDRIESMVGEGSGTEGKVEASKKFLEEVRGSDYRLEQATAKLVEFFELELELEKREQELVSILPNMSTKLAANDEFFSENQDKKYSVQ